MHHLHPDTDPIGAAALTGAHLTQIGGEIVFRELKQVHFGRTCPIAQLSTVLPSK